MGIWETDQFYKKTPISNIGGTLLLDEDIDFKILKKAIRKFVEKNDAMRTRIKVVEGKPLQYIVPYEYFPIKLHDFTECTKEEEAQWLKEKTETPISLCKEPLFRFYLMKSHDGRCGYLVVIHHIICDGWTNALKFGQTMEYYAKLASGGKIDSTTNPSYIDYIKKEKKYFKSERFQHDKEFWMARYEEKPVQNSIKLRDKENHNHDAKRSKFEIDGDLASKIHGYCKTHAISPAVLMESILGVYASRFHDVSEMTIGIPVLNRSGAREKSTVGMFVNTLPVKLKVDDKSNFLDMCKSVASQHMELFRHRRYPMNQLLSDLRKKHHITHNFYDICVSYSNGKIKKPNHDYKFSTNWIFHGTQADSLYLHIDDRDDNGTFILQYDYLVSMFSSEEIRLLQKRIMFLLEQCVTKEISIIGELELADTEEKETILSSFNNTTVDYNKSKCFHHCFEEQVKKTPDMAAVIFDDIAYSYDAVNQSSNALAKKLHDEGIGVNSVVGLLLNRSEKVIIAQLGTMKSGAYYVPIDPNYPQDRIDYMIMDSNAEVIITTRNAINAELINDNTKVIYIEDIKLDHTNKENPLYVCMPNDPAYLIYTSGSTGKPKGAIVHHAGLVNLCTESPIGYYGDAITNDLKNIISLSTISFDMFVLESLVPLFNGMTIIMANENEQNVQTKVNTLITKYNAEVLVATPTRMKLLLLDDSLLDYLSHLKVILVGGESFPEALYKQLSKLTEARIWNMYGPTETSVMCTQSQLLSDHITIGKPISNTKIYILDKYMKLLPVGASGELYVGGDGVGLGYLNRPELTQERFLDDPFNLGFKMYKTGDVGSWDAEGNIHYHCRNDFQVKINGLRIELGEIEDALMSIDSIEDAVVTVVGEQDEKQSLCAYYVSEQEIDNEAFHHILKESLPGYMIPLYYVKHGVFPLMPSGKVDRNQLPKPNLEQLFKKEIVAPRNEFEEKLADILCEVLEIDEVSIDDHIFYELGGDSFAAIQIQFLAEKAELEIDINDLYQYSSIRELSEIHLEDEVVHHYEDDRYRRVFQKKDITKQHEGMESVLLTGATGFLGSHILFQLLNDTDAEITCLVRNKERLFNVLEHYFGTGHKSYIDRVHYLEGDIELSNFGLSDDVYNELIDDIDSFIHTAANVRHFGMFEDFYKTNVLGTKEAISFCKKSNAMLHHVSTMSVSGDGATKQNIVNPRFSESNLYIGQDYQSNVYIHTKYLAEKEVVDALEHGLNACIHRVGNLMWRKSDGKFQMNIKENGFINRLFAFKKLGIIPDMFADLQVDITPIDQCAEAIVLLANSAKKSEIYHVINHHKVSYKDLLDKSDLSYDTVPFEQFFNKVSENRDDDQIGVLYLYLNQMIEYYHKMDVDVKSSRTKKKLKALEFSWKKLSDEYLSQCPVSN